MCMLATVHQGQPKFDSQIPNKGGRREQTPHRSVNYLLTMAHKNKNIQKVGTKLATTIMETGRADEQASVVH